MDKQIVEQKLESLRRCIERIQGKQPLSANDLETDIDKQDIISLNLSRAVQLTVDIGVHIISGLSSQVPETMGQTFEVLADKHVISKELAIRLKKSVGFRNIAVHNYDAINWDIVHSIVQLHLKDFSEFAKAILVWQDKNNYKMCFQIKQFIGDPPTAHSAQAETIQAVLGRGHKGSRLEICRVQHNALRARGLR